MGSKRDDFIKARKAAGFSQADLARRMEKRPETINRYESGEYNIPDSTMDLLLSLVGERASKCDEIIIELTKEDD